MPGLIPSIPHTLTITKDRQGNLMIAEWPTLRRILIELQNSIGTMRRTQLDARPVTNLRAIPMAGGNAVDFTPSDGDSYVVYIGETKDQSRAQAIDIGRNNRYEHRIGKPNQLRYYWVRAKRQDGNDSMVVGPVFSTSLSMDAQVTLPPVPPGSDTIYIDTERNLPVAAQTTGRRPKTL